MSREDWYRRTTWTEPDPHEFDARLNRSRGSGKKAQFLRIQALHLAEAGHHHAAVELLDFGWFVVEKQLTDFYQEVLRTLDEFRSERGLTFPAVDYRYCAIRALIADAWGDGATARKFAIAALEEASKSHSGLRYHPTIGLVGSEHRNFEKRLRMLAAT